MAVATRLQYTRVDPATVVADQNTKAVAGIFDFDFHAAGAGMVECVEDGLAADAIDIVAHQWMQTP